MRGFELICALPEGVATTLTCRTYLIDPDNKTYEEISYND